MPAIRERITPSVASRYSRSGIVGSAFTYRQNASTHGPPTSCAVLVNRGIRSLYQNPPLNRVRSATKLGAEIISCHTHAFVSNAEVFSNFYFFYSRQIAPVIVDLRYACSWFRCVDRFPLSALFA